MFTAKTIAKELKKLVEVYRDAPKYAPDDPTPYYFFKPVWEICKRFSDIKRPTETAWYFEVFYIACKEAFQHGRKLPACNSVFDFESLPDHHPIWNINPMKLNQCLRELHFLGLAEFHFRKIKYHPKTIQKRPTYYPLIKPSKTFLFVTELNFQKEREAFLRQEKETHAKIQKKLMSSTGITAHISAILH